MLTKFKNRRWWAKWLSISGVATIAVVIAALPQIKEIVAYGHDLATAPEEIRVSSVENAAAVKVVQDQVATLQVHEYEDSAWRAKTDVRLDNMEKMLTRILDNQEHQSRYNPPPKQNN